MNEFGRDLSVVIITETGKDWETFATWYSIFKNLPEAGISIISLRNKETPFCLYQWTKRLNIPVSYQNCFTDGDKIANKLNALQKITFEEQMLVLEPLVVATTPLETNLINLFKNNDFCIDINVWFMRKPNISNLLDQYFLEENQFKPNATLSIEAKESESPGCFVSYKKGCGKWINTLRGCPLSNAAGLVTPAMTVNENRVIDLWKRMCSLYSAIG